MARKRDYIEEILAKNNRHLRRVDRHEQFTRRVVPLVQGYRYILAMDKSEPFRNEWLKYGAIGYIACVEGYFRMLFADLINAGEPFSSNVGGFKDVKITIDDVLAIHSRKVSLGEYIAHLLPLNGIADIEYSMSTLIGANFLKLYKAQKASDWNPSPIGELWPKAIAEVEELFQLRHMYCHELAPKLPVQPRKVTQLISSAAGFISYTEELVQGRFLTDG